MPCNQTPSAHLSCGYRPLPVIPNQGDGMAAPQLLRTFASNGASIGASRPLDPVAHLTVMKPKKAKKASGGDPDG
jgi:hypothetical protein